MKASNANKVISVLLSVAMCPMMVPTAAFAADDGIASGASTAVEQAQPADQAEASSTGASSGNTLAAQSEAAEAATGEAVTGEAAAPAAAPAAAAGETAGEEAAPAATATINGYSTFGEAVQKATVDAQGVITYEVTGKVNVDSTGWVQVRPTAATDAKVVKFVGKSADAEICITQGVAILADQGSSALSVEFSNLKLSKPNPEYAGDYGQATEYFTTWLRNTDAASNCVTYTDCEFPNGVCNNQYGKTVFDNCTFTNTVTKLYNMWVYGGNVEVKGGSFTGVRGVKVYTEGTTTVAPKVDIAGASFAGISEKAAIVVSKPATVTLSNVSATDCTEGLIQKAIEGSSEKVTLNANGTGIGGNFGITAKTGSDATKAEFNLNAGTLTSEVSSDFLADGFTLSKSSDGTTFGVAEAASATVAEVNGVSYPSLQAAINAAARKATVKLLADTKENVTISTPYVTLDLNGHTLNGGTEKGKPALTVTARVTVKDGSETQTGTIMREDTAENSGVSSHYVIDVQGAGWLTFESGNVTNNSGAGGTKGASLVRVGDDSIAKYPGLNIKGGNFTQDNFIVIKVDRGDLFLNGGTLNSAKSYAIENWHRATVKGGTVNGAVAAWTYSGGLNSDLTISGGTVNGNVESVTYDGAEGKTAKVSITGGTVNGTLNTVDYSTGTTSNDPTKATIEVTSGTFSTDPSRYLVEGSAATPNGDGTYGVEKAYLAQVGATSYYTMDEAFKAQTASGEAITLLRDYTTGSTFNSGTVARVVDLNGHTWTCTGTDANSAAFEINNPNASLTVKNGKVVSSQLVGLIPSAMGGTIKYDNSTLTFEGVEASTTATSGIETNGNNTNDTVVLKNSKLNVPNGFGIYFPSSGTLTIDNSTINAKTMGAQVCSGGLNVTAGSAITVSGDPVDKLEGDGAIQDGAAISIVNRPGYKGLGKIAIAGGTFTAKTGNAALKAYTWDSATKQESAFENSAKTVAVSGGTFSSEVASDLCAEGYAPVANADGTYSVGTPVAQIDGTVYTTLQAAIDAAQAGDTVQLLADAVIDDTVIVQDKGAITLDLNGKTISNTKEIWNGAVNNWSLVSVRGNSDLTITGNGAIDALANDSYAIDLYDAVSKCTIENGTFTGNISAVYIFDGALTINGGTFDIKQMSGQGDRRFTINCYDSNYKDGTAQVSINGGTFNGFDPANNLAEGTGTAFTAPGYTSVDNGDGTYGVVAGVAQIGTKAYASLQTAIDAAQDGETVQLLADIVLDAQAGTEKALYPQFTISGKKLTLDMRGHKISYSEESRTKEYGDASLLTLSIDNGSDVTITGNGTIDTELGSSQAYGINIRGGSNLTIDNGTFYGAITAVQVQKGGLVINDGTFLMAPTCKEQVPQYAKFIINCIDAAWKDGSATVSIKGGTFGHDYSNNPEGEGTSYLAPGYAPTANADGTYGVVAGVAKIGTKAYATLADAVAAAQDGDTVQLLADVEQNSQLAIDKSITLDLNGNTIKNTQDIWGDNAVAILSITNGAKVAITGDGAIDAKENDCYTINVVKGDLTIENGTFYGNISVVQVQEGTLSVKGGTFDLHQKWEGSSKYLLNCIDDAYVDGSANVAISGGTFVGFDPNVSPEQKVDGKVPSFAAPGVGITKNEDGSFTAAASMTAQILDKDGNSVKAYASLQAAIAAAKDGQTVTLLTDVTEDVAVNKSITLDLGGKTLTNTNNSKATISVQGGTVTVKNGNVAGGTGYYNIEVTKGSNANLTLADVTATAGNTGSSMIDNYGTLTIESGSYTGGMNTVKSEEGSTLTINGGTFTCDFGKKWSYTAVILVYGTTTINGGEFIQKTANTSSYAKVIMTGKVDGYEATTKVTGGKFVNEKLSGIFWALGKATSDNFEVSGGTFNKYVSDSYMADGYIAVKNSDGTYGVKEGKIVAEVGSIGYEAFDEAIAAANASTSSKTVSLRENITVDHQLVINNAKGKAITLDLKGFTLTSTYAMNNASSEARYALVNKTTLTVKNGTFAAGEARAIGAYGALTLNGATVTQTLTGGHACVAFCANGKSYTIKNSTIDGAYAVCNFANNSTVNITGSKLVGTGNTLYHNGSNYGLKLTVKDTTITSSGSCGVYISGSTSAQSNADNQNGAGGYQKATFTGCTISGAINGVEVKYTDLTLDGCTASTTAKDASYKQDNNGPAGSGFAVVSTDNAMNNVTPKPEGTIIIKGTGKYTGPVGLGSLKSVKETYADFADETINISDGTFTTEVPAAYCAAGYAPTKNADGTYGVKLAEGAYLLQDYRSGDQTSWKYPTQEGMAFAGWYKDAAFETPCTKSDVEGAAYAKFVKITDLLQFRGGSLRMDLSEPSVSTYLRFGYTMAIPEGTTFVENGWYYKRVTVSSPDDVRFVAYNNAMNNDGTVTANLVFNNVKTSLYKANFTEKAFVKYVTADGTTVEAVESAYQSRSVSEVADAILKHPMASKAEKEYANNIKAAIQ